VLPHVQSGEVEAEGLYSPAEVGKLGLGLPLAAVYQQALVD